jgi:hypothetical protein
VEKNTDDGEAVSSNTKELSCADRGLDDYSDTINVNDAWNNYVATTTSPDYQEFGAQFCAANPHPPVDSVELTISCQMWSFPTPTQSGAVIDWTANSNNPAQINYHACQLKLQKETSFTGSTPPHPPTASTPTKYLSCADRGLEDYSKTINVNDSWNNYVATTTSPDYQEFEALFCAANPHPPVDSVELTISCHLWSFPTPTQSGAAVDWTANSNNPAQINYHACQLKLQKETSFTGSTPPHPPTPSTPVEKDGKIDGHAKYLSCEDQNLDDYSDTINVNDAWNNYVATTTSPDYQEFEAQFCAANPHSPAPGVGSISCRMWSFPTPTQNGAVIDWTASSSNPAQINYYGCQLKAYYTK